jgi:hypothetical protein
MEPADTTAAQILNDHLREWWSDIVIGAQNARWYGYSVLEAVYNENALHVNGDTITPFIGLEWIGEKPMQWYEPKNDGRLIYCKTSVSLALMRSVISISSIS